jgi:hypothetical protein
MTYVPNHNPWVATDTLTTTELNNFETIYDNNYAYIQSHIHDSLFETQTEMNAKYWWTGNDGHGSGADADSIEYGTGNISGAQLAAYSVKKGLIVMWAGAIVDIPAPWHLCDGTSGTINLTNKFIVGAGDTFAALTEGGSNTIAPSGTLTINTHQLTSAELAAHNHPFKDISVTAWSGPSGTQMAGAAVSGKPETSTAGSTPSAGGDGLHGHSTAEGSLITGTGASVMPYYYALAYIQKIT